MGPSTQPEPWLRGPIPGVHPFLAPLLHSFQQAREDLAQFTEGLTPEQVWARPQGLNALGRELKHIAGSTGRLVTYFEGRQLDAAQMAELKAEDAPGPSREELLARIDEVFRRAEGIIRSFDPARLAEPRAIGRKQLPTTAAGLLIHIAEHTQRHVGQAICAAKLARAITSG